MVDFQPIRGTADFFFIRHGESEGNRDGIIQGRSPSALTEKGRAQAREAGEWMRERNLDLILCSPLARAEQTARIIAEAAGVSEVRAVTDLVELDTGVFSDLTFEQARLGLPEAWRDFERMSWAGVPGAESVKSLTARAESVWRLLIGLHAGGKRSVLSVAHFGIIQWIIRTTLGCTSWMPLLSPKGNCAVSHLRVDNLPLNGGGFSYYASWLLINTPLIVAVPPAEK
jgi:broad specificity phosphatase PhoE